MQAVILAGGQGTRLLPLTLHTPKPLLPIVGRPLLSYLVRHLTAQGIDEIFITSGYLGDAVQRAAHEMQGDVPVRVIREAVVRGTAGAVLDLLPRLRSPFLVVSGDAVLALDARALLAAHRAAGGPATLAVMAPADRLRFGVVGVEAGLVTRFIEKPRVSELVPDLLLNSGSYLLEREAFRNLAEDRPLDFAHDVFPALLRTGHRLGAAPVLRFWRDIGTPESFRDAHFEALNGIWPWTAPDRGAPLAVGPGVTIEGVVGFGDGVLIGAGSRIRGPAYLGAGVRLGPGSEVTRSVLLAGSRTIGLCSVQNTVVGVGVSVARGVVVSGAVLGRLAAAPLPQRRSAHAPARRAGRAARHVQGGMLAARLVVPH